MEGHLMSEDLLASAIEMLPPSKLRAFVRSRQPQTQLLRRGVFGEVLAVRLLEELHGHIVPIKKLHYRTANYDSPKATDVLAIKINDELVITDVAYAEAKFRSTRDRIADLGRAAHNQLQNDCKDEIPGILGFAAQILKERNDPLFDSVMTYLRDRDLDKLDSHHIFLVVERGCWRDTDLDSLFQQDDLLEPLDVHVVMIDQLCDKTDYVYELIGFEATENED
jgi:hypothetical protein